MPSNRSGPFIFAAIIIVGCLAAGVWLSTPYSGTAPLMIAVLLACAVSALLYSVLGGVGEAGFNFGPLKMGGSAAVLIGSVFLFNNFLEEQLLPEPECSPWSLDEHAEPSRGWFAIDRETAEPTQVQLFDPCTADQVAFVPPPIQPKSLRFELADQDASEDHLVSGVGADASLGYIPHRDLARFFPPPPPRRRELAPDTTYGPTRLHLVNEGELPPDASRTWGGGRCLGTRLPLLIQVNRFEGGYADYEVSPCDSDELVVSSLRSGEGELRQFTINGRPRYFVISIVAADHRAPPFWSSFVVIEMVQSGL